MSCFVKQLARNFSDNLIGLNICPQGKASVCPSAFSCCHDHALLSIKQNQAVELCALHARLCAVQQLLNLYEQVWGKPFAFYSLRNDEVVTTFIQNLRGGQLNSRKGSAFTSKSSKLQASPIIWLLALVATWRFGLKAHVVSLGKSGPHALIPKTFAQGLLVLVEQKESLRFPHIAFDFTTLVNWCEGAMIPLWIDALCENTAKSETTTKSENTAKTNTETQEQTTLHVKSAFKKRAARYLSAPPFSWLDADCQSRLQSVCFFHKHFC